MAKKKTKKKNTELDFSMSSDEFVVFRYNTLKKKLMSLGYEITAMENPGSDHVYLRVNHSGDTGGRAVYSGSVRDDSGYPGLANFVAAAMRAILTSGEEAHARKEALKEAYTAYFK